MISPQIVTSATRPTGRDLFEGLEIYELDTHRKLQYDGTGWIIQSEPAITTYVPTVTSASGTITTVGAKSFVYKRRDGWLDWWCDLAITTNGTGAGTVFCTLPVNANTVNVYVGNGREYAISGNQLECFLASASIVQIVAYNNTYPGANGTKFACSGAYQMATRYS